MDPSQYDERHGGLPLHELLKALEEDDVDSADIYITPPQDGEETDQDSDDTDDEHDGNINHLGPAMLKAEAEVILHRAVQPDSYSTNTDLPTCSRVVSEPSTPNITQSPFSVQNSSDDDLPLSSFIQSKEK